MFLELRVIIAGGYLVRQQYLIPEFSLKCFFEVLVIMGECKDCLEELDILRKQVHELTASYQKGKRMYREKIERANKLYYEYQTLSEAFAGQKVELEDLRRRGEGSKAFEFYKKDSARLQKEKDRSQKEWQKCRQDFEVLQDQWEDLKVDYETLYSKHRATTEIRKREEREKIKTLNKVIGEGFEALQATFAAQPMRGPLRKKPRGRRLTYAPYSIVASEPTRPRRTRTKTRSTHRLLTGRKDKYGRDIYV